MSQRKPTYQELEKRLAAAEPIVEALKRHEVDAIVGEEKIAFLLLREVGDALLHSEAGFSAMFELPGIGMVQADTPAFRFTRVNQKFCEMIGYGAAELLTKTYIGLTHLEDRQRDMNGLTGVLRGKADFWSIEKRCVCKDGRVIWVDVNGAALRDHTGRTIRVMVMFSDITELKEAAQALRNRAALLDAAPSKMRLATERERRRTVQILAHRLAELEAEYQRPLTPKQRVAVQRVRQALKDVRNILDQSRSLPRAKSAAHKGKASRHPPALTKKARSTAHASSTASSQFKKR